MKSLGLLTKLGMPALAVTMLIYGCEIVQNLEYKERKRMTFEKIVDLQRLREPKEKENICLPNKNYLGVKAKTIIQNYGCNFKSLAIGDVIDYINELNPRIEYLNGKICVIAPKYKDCLLKEERDKQERL